LVLDGGPGALGIVRSLGRRGIAVWALLGEHKLAALSRYCTRAISWPNASEPDKLRWLKELGRSHNLDGWVLFSASDETARFMSVNRAALMSQYRLTTPDWEMMRWAYDKRLTHQLAASLGLSQPQTLFPRNREELESLKCDFPVVLKPAFKPVRNRFTRSKAWLAHDRCELLELYDEAVALIDPSLIMIQKMIDGGGENQFSYACFSLDGRPLGSLTARRTRQYPVDFGYSSSLVETVELPEIEKAATSLLSYLRYSGVSEVEFKYDSIENNYKLLDINPRFWTWHSLGAVAGVDFPYLVWQAANDEAITEVRAIAGHKWVHMMMDLAAGAGEISRRRISLARYLRSLSRISEFAILSSDDPLPGLLEPGVLVYSRITRFVRRQRVESRLQKA